MRYGQYSLAMTYAKRGEVRKIQFKRRVTLQVATAHVRDVNVRELKFTCKTQPVVRHVWITPLHHSRLCSRPSLYHFLGWNSQAVILELLGDLLVVNCHMLLRLRNVNLLPCIHLMRRVSGQYADMALNDATTEQSQHTHCLSQFDSSLHQGT